MLFMLRCAASAPLPSWSFGEQLHKSMMMSYLEDELLARALIALRRVQLAKCTAHGLSSCGDLQWLFFFPLSFFHSFRVFCAYPSSESPSPSLFCGVRRSGEAMGKPGLGKRVWRGSRAGTEGRNARVLDGDGMLDTTASFALRRVL